MSAMEKKELGEILRIAYIHAGRIKMALDELRSLLPFDVQKIESLSKENLVMTDFLIHRFGKLQDLIGNKLINEFLILVDEYAPNLSMLDKIHKIERLEIIEDTELWKEMRGVRNHLTYEYPDHPEFTANDLNLIVKLAPTLLSILDKIKDRVDKSPKELKI